MSRQRLDSLTHPQEAPGWPSLLRQSASAGRADRPATERVPHSQFSSELHKAFNKYKLCGVRLTGATRRQGRALRGHVEEGIGDIRAGGE
jgi:hypothetical protein